MAKTTVKSQDKIDNRKNLMDLVGAIVKDGKVIFQETDNIFIVLDTETTGLDAQNDKVIQFSAVKYRVENGKLIEIDRFDTYINQPLYDENKVIPGKNGAKDITFKELTGITNKMLASAPSEAEAFEKISEFLGPDPIFICYNTPFDYSMMVQMYINNGAVLHVSPERKLDVLVMARDLVSKEDAPVLLDDDGNPVLDSKGAPKKTHKLSYIAGLYGLDKAEDDSSETIAFHSSINDVVVTGRLLNVFISEYATQIEEELKEPVVTKSRARVESINYWEGYRGFSRLYINAMLDGELVSYYYDVRKKEWGEKQEDLIVRTMFDELKKDALELAGCANETEFGRLTSNFTADATFLARYDE